MMGMPCVKNGGKLALGFVRDEGAVVFKLEDAEQREAALALDGAHLFDPSGKGRPFKEWVVVPPMYAVEWERLGAEALGSSEALARARTRGSAACGSFVTASARPRDGHARLSAIAWNWREARGRTPRQRVCSR